VECRVERRCKHRVEVSTRSGCTGNSRDDKSLLERSSGLKRMHSSQSGQTIIRETAASYLDLELVGSSGRLDAEISLDETTTARHYSPLYSPLRHSSERFISRSARPRGMNADLARRINRASPDWNAQSGNFLFRSSAPGNPQGRAAG